MKIAGRIAFFMILLGYQARRWPKLQHISPEDAQPWALCISGGPTQYLFAVDEEPGRVYKMTLEGKILGMFGESGRQLGQLNWAHGISCRSEDTLYIADMNNWRVQKILLYESTDSSGDR